MAQISGDEVDGCTLTELLDKLNMRHFTHLSIANRRTALERQANYNVYPSDDPNEDPKGNEPSHPSRVNPKVPVLRTSQAVDGKPSRVASNGPATTNSIISITPTPSAKGPRAHHLVLLATGKRSSSPKTAKFKSASCLLSEGGQLKTTSST